MSDRDEPSRSKNSPPGSAAQPSRTSFRFSRSATPFCFHNSFMPLAVARESSVRLIDEAISGGKLIGVFTQRDATVEEPQQGDLLSARHGESHPQDVQAARRQPAADRPGARAAAARRGHRDAAVPARPRQPARRRPAPTREHLEIDALLRNIKTNFQQVVSLSPLLSDDLQTLSTNITDPDGSPTSSRRA